MIPYPKIDPIIFSVGPVHVRWYGLMYVMGFIASYLLIQKQKRSKQVGLVGATAQDLVFYLAIGVIAGGRLGYILFYEYLNLGYYVHHPLEIIATWHGGMSFHGGLIGCVIAGWLFARRKEIPFAVIADSAIVTAPIGLGLGRIGNFINAELLGLPSHVPWAMIFPGAPAWAGGAVPRHPTQLYEAFAEGLLLFIIMWQLRKRQFKDGMMVAFFLLFYAVFRFIIECFKEPDPPPLGYVFHYLTVGQVLCIAMVPAALALIFFINRKKSGEAVRAKGAGAANRAGR
ncbi:MAG: prolipoprotein diacylglyceryl transferase [Syntrophobacteraceae bacterium]|nr:prolipoprotein diacylglyceryl transferase [Syntrophobacteraceae bacterium]